MTSRERVRMALAHQEPDRIPLDFDGTGVTGICAKAYLRLREYLHLPQPPLRIGDPMQQLAVIDEDLLSRFRVDVRAVKPHPPAGWSLTIRQQDGVPYYTDEWGIGWRMPPSSNYFDMGFNPLREADSLQEVERFPWPDGGDPARFAGMAQRARQLHDQTGAALALNGFSAGIFEMTSWLFGYEQCLMNMAANMKLMQAVMEKVAEIRIRYWEAALPLVAPLVDVVIESDDLGHQSGLLFSPQIYRQYLKPLHARTMAVIRKYTDAPIFFHSCGSVYDLIPDLIECGVQILNPVQMSAVKMDPAVLKKEFGRDLSFWGGACDCQKVLWSGTVQEVRDEVKRRIKELAPGGGFVFAPVHNIQAGVPPENIMALWETWDRFAEY